MKLGNIFYSLIAFASPSLQASDFALCSADETTVWACNVAEKEYAICASPDLNEHEGYLQYRDNASVSLSVFQYPASYRHPQKYFSFRLDSNKAILTFNVDGNSYLIEEDINGAARVHIHQLENGTLINCDDSTDTLTLTSTINFLKGAGITR